MQEVDYMTVCAIYARGVAQYAHARTAQLIRKAFEKTIKPRSYHRNIARDMRTANAAMYMTLPAILPELKKYTIFIDCRNANPQQRKVGETAL
jgi:hypothetical protein